MSQVATSTPGDVVWIDLATSDPAAAEEFYRGLFGWERDVNPDPQYGGYGFFKAGGKIAAGVGPVMSEGQPVVWQAYVGTQDADETARKVEAAGGKIVAPPFAVGEQGRMAVFQDPAGAFISIWESSAMPGIEVRNEAGSLGWTELQTQDLSAAKPFYEQVFGWGQKMSDVGGGVTYTEWQLNGRSVGGAIEGMAPTSFWLVYFQVRDVDASAQRAKELGGRLGVEPED
jgi:predicted enzyme related to lactoylglutathione lyase